MKPVRQVLCIPADPGRQRSVLVVLIHRREVAPLGVSAQKLHRARLEVDAEPFPLEQEQTGP